MRPRNVTKIQSKYLNRISRHKLSARCRECGEWVRIPQFEKHVQKQHLVPICSCPWCFGDYKFPYRKKAYHIPHLDSCLDAFIKRYSLVRSRSLSPPPLPIRSRSKRPRTTPYPPVYDAATRTTIDFQPSSSSSNTTDPSLSSSPSDVNDLPTYVCDRVHTLPDRVYFEYEPAYPERDLMNTKTFPIIGPNVFEMKFTLETAADDTIYAWWKSEFPAIDNNLTFRGNDEIGIYYVKMYLRMKEVLGPKFDMWHIFVRFPAYKSFEEQMTLYGDGAFLLPFACLCKGGGSGTLPEGSAYEVYRHHKHLLLAIRDVDEFRRSCWQKIKKTLQLPKGVKKYKSKGHKVIKSDLHLGFTIRYLGKPQSRCIFMDGGDVDEEEIEFVPLSLLAKLDELVPAPPSLLPDPHRSRSPKHMNHYFIEKSVSRHFMFALASQVEGMWDRLFNVLCGSKSVEQMTEKCIEVSNGRGHYSFWVKIKYALEQNPSNMFTVLHVDKKWVPYKIDTTYSDAFMYLIGDEKLHFKESRCAENMSDFQWYWMQLQRGNIFAQVIGESSWRPTKYQQTALWSSVQFAKNWRLVEAMYEDKRDECETHKLTIAERDQTIVERDQTIEEQVNIIGEHEKKSLEQTKIIEEHENKSLEQAKIIEHHENKSLQQAKIIEVDQKIIEAHQKKHVELSQIIQELKNTIEQKERRNVELNTMLMERLDIPRSWPNISMGKE